MDKPLVTIATYNEIENLPALVDKIFRHAPQCDVLVIDDNSPDGTGKWCDEHAAHESRLSCLHREGKLGLGTALIAGLRCGIERGYRYVLSMDADFSHPPANIPHLLDGMEPPGAHPIDVMIAGTFAELEVTVLEGDFTTPGDSLRTAILGVVRRTKARFRGKTQTVRIECVGRLDPTTDPVEHPARRGGHLEEYVRIGAGRRALGLVEPLREARQGIVERGFRRHRVPSNTIVAEFRSIAAPSSARIDA